MLLELRVENLLLIERAELRLEAGLTVLTGETGAGKTVLAHALDLLLGGPPRPGGVRPGAAGAEVAGAGGRASGVGGGVCRGRVRAAGRVARVARRAAGAGRGGPRARAARDGGGTH